MLATALLSDTGGVATLVGDPPNLMIGSAADIDFNTFFKHMGGIVDANGGLLPEIGARSSASTAVDDDDDGDGLGGAVEEGG